MKHISISTLILGLCGYSTSIRIETVSRNNFCLAQPASNTESTTKLTLWDCQDGINQQFNQDKQAILLRNGVNLCVDAERDIRDGVLLIQFPCHGGDNQQWTYYNDDTIRPASDPTLCWQVMGATTSYGANIQLSQCNGQSNQKWRTDLTVETLKDGFCPLCSDEDALKSPNALVSNKNPDLKTSSNYRLSMQSDGNLVLYKGLTGYDAQWKNEQWTPRPSSFYRLAMQSDGNLVQYDSNGQMKWSTNTGGRPEGKFCGKVEKNGNMRVFDSNCNTLWSSQSGV